MSQAARPILPILGPDPREPGRAREWTGGRITPKILAPCDERSESIVHVGARLRTSAPSTTE